MSADYFLDSNILLYSFDPAAARKQRIARMLVDGAVHEGRGVISSQVCQEFCNVMLHKLAAPIPPRDLEAYLESTVYPLIRVLASPRLFAEAVAIHQQTQYRFYDSLIVAAALESGVPTLYSEDLQHDRLIGSLRIVNPFLEESVDRR
jgi:predicted nucleic acid-binding protein